MGISSKLVQRITKITSADAMHTSGYARVQNGGSIGATSGESFAQRQAVDKNRQVIQGYNRSRMGQQRNPGQRALTYQEKESAEQARREAVEAARNAQLADNNGLNRLDMTQRLNRSFSERGYEGGYGSRGRRLGMNPEAPQRTGYGRVSAEQARAARQERSQRFGGGLGRVDTPNSAAVPGPKTGGFQGGFGSH